MKSIDSCIYIESRRDYNDCLDVAILLSQKQVPTHFCQHSTMASTIIVLRLFPLGFTRNQNHTSPSHNWIPTTMNSLLFTPNQNSTSTPTLTIACAWEEGRFIQDEWMGDGSSSHGRRSYPFIQFHHYRGKEPKLTSSTPSGQTIYQNSITKLLELEASALNLKNFP